MSSTDETRPVDPPDGAPIAKKPTPIPKMQLFILLVIQFAEPVTALVIYPFVVQFLRDTGVAGGDEARIGFYAGILESTFFLAESLTVFQFGRLSDAYGRRPVLLFAPLGLAVAMFGFGLSTSYPAMLFWRFAQGVWNGNTGVARTAMGEISDSTNRADVFSFMPLMWSSGATLGPAIGGLLANPASKWPDTVLGHIELLRAHPYFLPCAVSGTIAFLAYVLAVVGLKETLPTAVARASKDQMPTETSPLLPAADDAPATVEADKRLPIRTLLTRPVKIALLNHAFLTFGSMSYEALLPIVYATPIELGGLGLSPHQIGLLMGTVGLVNAVIQATLGGRSIRYFGARNLFTVGLCAIALAMLFYGVTNALARRAGRVDILTAAAIAVQMSCSVFLYFAFCVGNGAFCVRASAPNAANLGAVSGLSATIATGLRAVAPTVASTLFSFSVKNGWAGGYAGFVALATVSVVGAWTTRMLPAEPHAVG
ncbi:MFS domain-containing protein [Mycena kentingensis (nom. inval.)]|nr:MFS domain-containing protein [Mycena kentingensis (nom. inval.)]